MRKLVLIVLFFASVMLAWTLKGYFQHKFADRQVRDALSQLTVSLDLLSAETSQALHASDTLVPEGYGAITLRMTKEERLVSIAEAFENVGLHPLRLVFRDPQTFEPVQFWKVEFPGCKPQTCVETAQNMEFQPATRELRDDYRAGYHGLEAVTLPERTHLGVTYTVVATAFLDSKGAVTKIDMIAYRPFRSAFEEFVTKMASGGGATAKRAFSKREVISHLTPL
ncbi:hypothetical protein [uncultured Tateyamaria sp.]|uniref:hypothetical protein n=1 Tax=uncultured Tateyamaria sp. TaxID=455651 RepID=UPI00260FE581|nr:hypothetical protein [uncultured Tateyamaria sp.]